MNMARRARVDFSRSPSARFRFRNLQRSRERSKDEMIEAQSVIVSNST